jgi:tetratricopeptide (TPR) repeat protein/transposase
MSVSQTASRVQEAQALHRAGQDEEAIRLLIEILGQEPNDMTARELLGDIYYARDEYKQARQQYRYVFDRRRHEVSVALKLVEVYLCLPKKLRQAYNVLHCTVQSNPDDLTALLRYANFCRVLINDGEDVEDLYRRIETLSAGDLEKELACAADHLFTGQLERAKEACARALALAGEDSRAYQILCHIYLGEGVLWLAQAAADQVLALAGPSVQAYHDLAVIRLKAGEDAAALEAWEQALVWAERDEERVPLWRQIAVLQMKQESYAEALVTLERVLAWDEQDLTALYSLIVAHQQLTDYAAALEVLETRLLPQVGAEARQARLLQGALHLQAGELEKARDLFAALVEVDKACADYHYYLALTEQQLEHKIAACQAVNRALRCNRQHPGARALYDQLHARSPQEEQKKPQPERYFDPLDLDEFLAELAIQDRIAKLVAYIERRYWKERDRRGKKPEVSHRTVVLMRVVMGLKDWNLHQLHEKLRSKEHGGPLRKLLGLPDNPQKLPVYTTFERRLDQLGVYPLKFLMRQWVREAVQKGYIDVSNVLLDTTLIAAYTDLARFFPDSPTDYSDPQAAWSYPKPWTGRVFGFKLSLATAKEGEPIDADLVPANPNDITLGKQAVRRLGRTFAPLNIKVEFVIADGGYDSDPLRELVAEVLGAIPLFRFNPRNGAQRQAQYTYLNDPDEWLKVKRRLRQIIERSFAQLKKHFGLDNLRIRGLTQVAQYVLSRCLAYLACTLVAHEVGRPDLKASPSRLLYSY